MKYEGMIYRPPSEADSLILQATVGCAYNRCTFCHSYQGKTFRIKSFKEIKEDIDEASHYGPIRRVFLADGNALVIPQEDLIQILTHLKLKLSGLERVGIYANARDILNKEVMQLIELKKLGMGIIYLGLESGNREVLKRIKKRIAASSDTGTANDLCSKDQAQVMIRSFEDAKKMLLEVGSDAQIIFWTWMVDNCYQKFGEYARPGYMEQFPANEDPLSTLFEHLPRSVPVFDIAATSLFDDEKGPTLKRKSIFEIKNSTLR